MKKHFVLYPDRLDYFDNAVDAVSSQKPLGRIALQEVMGHEIFGCGLILDLLGRKVGLKADHDSDVKQWDAAIKQAMTSIRPPGFSSIPLSQRGSARARSTTPRVRKNAKPRVFDYMGARAPKNASGVYSGGETTDRSLSPGPSYGDSTLDSSMRSRSAPPAEARKREAKPHADQEGWVHIHTFNRWQHEGGRPWLSSEVADKVQKREGCLKDCWHPHSYNVVPKLTGEDTIIPPLQEIAHKVNVPDEESRLSMHRLKKERCARHGLPAKITCKSMYGSWPNYMTTTDRIHLRAKSPDTHTEVEEKITTTPSRIPKR